VLPPNRRFEEQELEAYLKGFHPEPPQPLPVAKHASSRSWLAVAVAATVAIATLVIRPHIGSVGVHQAIVAGPVAQRRPLTIGTANDLLISAPSFKNAVDELSIPSPTSISEGQQSAIEVLSQENTKL
jgi:hypothetical protein